MKNVLKIVVFLSLIQSCKSEGKVVNEIMNDSSLINGSVKELINNYDTCISIFDDKRYEPNEARKIIYQVYIRKLDIPKIDTLGLIKTSALLKKGYRIKIYTYNPYSIFYEKDIKESTWDIEKYSVWYKHRLNNSTRINEIDTSNIKILKSINKEISIVKIVEHSE